MSYSVCLPNYSIGVDCYGEIETYAKKFGTKVVVIGGKTALEKARPEIESALQESDLHVLDWLWYGGNSTYENGDALILDPKVQEADMIFGVGGGRALDTCKYVANEMHKPLFNFPTVGSNCAAVTAISVIYNPDGSMREYYYPKLAEHTFIHTGIIADSPRTLLWAGIGDALSKECEAVFSSKTHDLAHTPLMGVQLSKICTEPLLRYGQEALGAIENKKADHALEQVVLDIIISTGLVSNMTTQMPDYYYNSSLAHCIYYGSTITEHGHEHLHGEIVSLGVLCLLLYDRQMELHDRIMRFNAALGLPISFDDLDISEAEFDAMIEYITTHCTEWKYRDPSIDQESLKRCMIEQNMLGRNFKNGENTRNSTRAIFS